jgi:hypothetical protein
MDSSLGTTSAPAVVNLLSLLDSVVWEANTRDIATGHDGNAGLEVVADFLGILHSFPEDGIPGTRVVLQVCFITAENVLGPT